MNRRFGEVLDIHTALDTGLRVILPLYNTK
jgi:hypothetical protein